MNITENSFLFELVFLFLMRPLIMKAIDIIQKCDAAMNEAVSDSEVRNG